MQPFFQEGLDLHHNTWAMTTSIPRPACTTWPGCTTIKGNFAAEKLYRQALAIRRQRLGEK